MVPGIIFPGRAAEGKVREAPVTAVDLGAWGGQMAGRARAGGGSRSRGGAKSREAPPGDREILVEFHRVGNAVKVTAVDPDSLTEVSLVGDPAMGEAALARAAVRKLRYVLGRRAGAAKSPPEGKPGGGRGGTLV